MALLIISPRDAAPWVEALKNINPDLDLRIYPEEGDPEEIEFALVWKHPPGIFDKYPNLKVIASMGAGVDHILKDPNLPKNVKITRVVDKQLSKDMAEFVLSLVLNQIKNLTFYRDREQEQLWEPKPYLRISEVKIGVMGTGVLGTEVAEKLLLNGFQVSGWSRTIKNDKKFPVFSGEEELDNFLNSAAILVCLLPLTASTENILNKNLFEKLPENAFIINVARGEHLVDKDLLQMLDSGHLSGAALDVFSTEPLPENHPFWKHKKIQITPHIASITKPATVVPQILENYNRMKKGETLINLVEPEKGY